MKASIEYDSGPNWEKTKYNWRKLVLDAYKYAGEFHSLLSKNFVNELMESKNGKSLLDIQNNKQAIERILDELFKDSWMFLYEEYYNAVLSDNLNKIEKTLEQSVENAEEMLEELYIDRCILPAAFYISVKYEIESKKAKIRNEDIDNPEILFLIGLEIKENADRLWEDAKQNCKNFEEWLIEMYRLFSLYKVSVEFLLKASELYKKQGKNMKRDCCIQEEYSADEFAASCYANVLFYGLSYFGAIFDMLIALIHKDVKSAKRAILFHYSAVPDLPKFIYDSMNEFLDNMMNETNLLELFKKEEENIIKKYLDEFSIKLFEEAKFEREKDKEDYFAVAISKYKEILDIICCPFCKSELNIVEITREEKIEKGIDGFLVCKSKRCGKKYPIEYGIVKWGINEKCAQLILY